MPRERREILGDKINQAGKAFLSFKERNRDRRFFTRRQREERMRTFLETHIGMLDEYVSLLPPERGMLELSTEGIVLANETAMEYPDSKIGRRYRGVPLEGDPQAAQAPRQQAPQGAQAPRQQAVPAGPQAQGEIDLQGKLYENYDRRLDRRAVNDQVRREGQQRQEPNGLRDNLSDAQINGIREICAWMYRSTKTHQKFVDAIAARTPREKLLMFYLVEKEKLHNMTEGDILLSQSYVPTVDAFEKKMYYRKHWYKFGGKNINWNIVADAADAAYRVRGMLGEIGLGQAPAVPQQNAQPAADQPAAAQPAAAQPAAAPQAAQNAQAAAQEEAQAANQPENEGDNAEEFEIIQQINANIDGIHDLVGQILANMNGTEAQKRQVKGLMDQLNQDIQALNLYVDQNAAFVQAKGGIPSKGKTGVEWFNDHSSLAGKYASTVRSGFALCASTMKDMKTDSVGNAASLDLGLNYTNYFGMALDGPLALINLLSSWYLFTGWLKSFGTSNWREVVGKFGTFISTFAGAGKSGLGAAQTGASVFANASWGTAGKAAVATTLKNVGAYAGIGIGAVNAGVGFLNYRNASRRSNITDEVEENLGRGGFQLEAAQNTRREGTNQLLTNIIASNRQNIGRTKKSAALQMAQGGFTAASGGITLAVGATVSMTGIGALVLSGAALAIGIYSIISQKKSKTRQMKDVIDRYVGMEGIYRGYLRRNVRGNTDADRDRWIARQGGEEKVRDQLRVEVSNALGFPDPPKLYANIMLKYAQTLYNLAFFKNGRRVKLRQVQAKDGSVVDQELYNYGKMIMALGPKVHYGNADTPPSPGVGAILARLMA